MQPIEYNIVCCGQRPQHLRDHKWTIYDQRRSQFVVAKGHNILKVTKLGQIRHIRFLPVLIIIAELHLLIWILRDIVRLKGGTYLWAGHLGSLKIRATSSMLNNPFCLTEKKNVKLI